MGALVEIKTFLHRYQAEVAKGLLAEKDIEAIVSADDAGGLRSHLAFGMGGVRLLVRQEDFSRAQDALKILEEEVQEKDED